MQVWSPSANQSDRRGYVRGVFRMATLKCFFFVVACVNLGGNMSACQSQWREMVRKSAKVLCCMFLLAISGGGGGGGGCPCIQLSN